MTDLNPDRRALLAAGAVLAAAGGGAAARAAPAKPQPKPLGFDPAAVPGLSEKLLRSHYDNNYTGAVNRRILRITRQRSKTCTQPSRFSLCARAVSVTCCGFDRSNAICAAV